MASITKRGDSYSVRYKYKDHSGNFYSQDLTPAAPQSRQNEKPAATKISGKEILEAIRLMDADERRELTRALFA